jgi:hypothetical protein
MQSVYHAMRRAPTSGPRPICTGSPDLVYVRILKGELVDKELKCNWWDWPCKRLMQWIGVLDIGCQDDEQWSKGEHAIYHHSTPKSLHPRSLLSNSVFREEKCREFVLHRRFYLKKCVVCDFGFNSLFPLFSSIVCTCCKRVVEGVAMAPSRIRAALAVQP